MFVFPGPKDIMKGWGYENNALEDSKRRKRYVEVVVRYFDDGKFIPLSIVWEGGRVFEVDRVLDVRHAASLKVGGVGVRFTVRIGQCTTSLFFENPRWFVEEITAEA